MEDFSRVSVYWQYNCGQRGKCWVYNNTSLARLGFTTGIVAPTAALGFYIVTWLTYPKWQANDAIKCPAQEMSSAADAQEQSEDATLNGFGRNSVKEKTSQATDTINIAKDGMVPSKKGAAQITETQAVWIQGASH